MNVAVISGKGGTGKTLVATNLAVYMKANYIDADVEEPNGFIFLKPDINNTKKVVVKVPEIDREKCKLCFKCVDFCEFNALAKSQNEVLILDKLCHSCGGCRLMCEFNAIKYKKKTVGLIETGTSNNIRCQRGILNIGEPMAVPVINELLHDLDNSLNIIDASPGTSCNVVNTLHSVDMSILVTEPTEFGLHDLKRAIKLVQKFKIPFGVIINKTISEKNIIHEYCKKHNISIITEIKYDKKIAISYSKGLLLVNDPKYHDIFKRIESYIRGVLCK